MIMSLSTPPVDTSVPICRGQRAHDSFRRSRWRQRLLAEREQPARCDSLVDDLVQVHGGPALGALRILAKRPVARRPGFRCRRERPSGRGSRWSGTQLRCMTPCTVRLTTSAALLAGQVQRGEGERTEVRAGWGAAQVRSQPARVIGHVAPWPGQSQPSSSRPTSSPGLSYCVEHLCINHHVVSSLVVSADGMRGRSRGCPLLMRRRQARPCDAAAVQSIVNNRQPTEGEESTVSSEMTVRGVAEPMQPRSNSPFQPWLRLLLGVLGGASFAGGVAAVFVTANGTGTGMLITFGGILLVLALLGDRIESFEFGGSKLKMRAAAAERFALAEESEDRGDDRRQPDYVQRLGYCWRLPPGIGPCADRCLRVLPAPSPWSALWMVPARWRPKKSSRQTRSSAGFVTAATKSGLLPSR